MSVSIDLLKLVNSYVDNYGEERLILIDALNCEDYNLARLIVESQLEEFESEFKNDLIKDNIDECSHKLVKYSSLIKINNYVTKLYEGD